MAKKKKRAKEKLSPLGNPIMDPTQEFSAKEIKDYTQMLHDILTKKTAGFVYMVLKDERAPQRGAEQKANGIIFIHKIAKTDVVGNLVDNLGISPSEMLMLTLNSKQTGGPSAPIKVSKSDLFGHGPDCDC